MGAGLSLIRSRSDRLCFCLLLVTVMGTGLLQMGTRPRLDGRWPHLRPHAAYVSMYTSMRSLLPLWLGTGLLWMGA